MNKKTILALIFIFALSQQEAIASNHKPLFVTITSDCCYTCKKLAPVLEELQAEYDGQVEFITLNISSRDQIEEANQMAREYGIDEFFNKNKSSIPKVGIFCPGGTKVKKEFLAETRKEAYENELNKLLADTYSVCSL